MHTQNVLPKKILPLLLAVLEQQKNYIDNGALLTVDEGRKRVRILPIGE